MKLYDCETAPSPRRVRIFAAEKGLELETVAVDLSIGEQFSPEYREINPDCVVPTLQLDDGTCISEVVAICHYLEELRPEPSLFGRTAAERALVLMWSTKAEQQGLWAAADAFRNAAKGLKGRAIPGPDDFEQIPQLAERGRERCGSFLFVDELAVAAGRDPVDYRRSLLAESPDRAAARRARGVLERAAEAAGWGRPTESGVARGVALHASFGSWVAEVVEVELQTSGFRVRRIVCAVDCGQIVNPDTVAAQMEGGALFGLSAALYGEMPFERGAAARSNFHEYRLLRMAEAPRVDVEILNNDESPGGAGEPATPPVAPALANALFAASGRRLRSLPLQPAWLGEPRHG